MCEFKKHYVCLLFQSHTPRKITLKTKPDRIIKDPQLKHTVKTLTLRGWDIALAPILGIHIACTTILHKLLFVFRWPCRADLYLSVFQGACVIEELMKFAGSSPCVLAGDFNTQPDMPLYQMILSGCVCEDTMDLLTSDEGCYVDSKLTVDKQVNVEK